MTEQRHVHPTDLHGLTRLVLDAALGLTDLVEAMHANIAGVPGIAGAATPARTRGITSLVYESIRGITSLIGGGLDAALGQLVPLLSAPGSSPEREAVIAALNGILGDYLAATANPLATPMQLWHGGQPLGLGRAALARSIPAPHGKILVLVHGLCMNDTHWLRKGHDHGARLAAELGYTALYLRYNSGLHISTNGRALADQIADLLHRWPVPVEQLTIIGHSMGGLVARSACHYGAAAGHTWPRQLQHVVFLGTPHHGAPLERIGNVVHAILGVSPYTAALARLGRIRSAGITDLRYGSLLDEDWAERDRFTHADHRRQVPLPPGARCYTIGATTGKSAGDLRDQLVGDGLVPLASALGQHPDPRLAIPFPASRQWVGCNLNHLDLLDSPAVYAQLARWLAS
jgi:pimeloyl-ACP methyl ester carboxylesterase